MLRFYLRVLLRVPGVFYNAAAAVGALVFLVAAVVLGFNKTLASDIASWHGFSPIWAVAPCSLVVAYGLAKANYEEARRFAPPTNRTNPSRSPITIENMNVYFGGPNSALPPDVLPGSRSQETQTETENEQ